MNHGVVNTKFLRPVAESMDDFGGKDVDSGDYVSREEWARSNLTWSAEMGMFEIPGTGYIPHGDEGCVEHANHLYFVRNFPNLVERPEQGYNKVFLPADQVKKCPAGTRSERPSSGPGAARYSTMTS